MKKICSFVIVLGLLASPALGAELLAPGDAIIAIDADGPVSFSGYYDNEAPSKILDGDVGTKYLNFGNSRYNTGFIVTPTVGSSVVQSFQISTANDASDRNPVTYEIYGTNDAITSTNNGLGNAENWTLIGSGTTGLPNTYLTAGPVINLTNGTAYSSYKMTFPTVNTSRGNGLMQISEVDFFDGLDGLGSNLLGANDPILAVQLTPDSFYPEAENPSKLLDGNTGTKYLNFGKANTGFIVTPSGTEPVRGFEITTANDWLERTPSTWALYGTFDAITSEDDSQGLAENWVLIDSGSLPAPGTDEYFTSLGLVGVDNDTAYTSYKMLFPTLVNADATNSMQISEVQFYDVPEPATLALLGLGGLLLRRRK